jgi:hypothetical protein
MAQCEVAAALASTTPAATGTAAVGVGTTAARSDHAHALGLRNMSVLTLSLLGYPLLAHRAGLGNVGFVVRANPSRGRPWA